MTVLLLLSSLDHLEALLTVLKFVFLFALLGPVLEKFWDLYVLVAVFAGCQILAFFGEVKVVKVFIEEGFVDLVTVFTGGRLFLLVLEFLSVA